MTNEVCFTRLMLGLLLTLSCTINSVQAHYPHDIHEFIELSPDYHNDHTAFIVSKQASSTRPVTPLVSRDAGSTWEFNAKGIDNLGKLTSATVSPAYATDRTVIVTGDGQGVYRTLDGGLSWARFNSGLTSLNLHGSIAGMDSQGGVTYFVSATGGGLYRLMPGASTWSQRLGSATIVSALEVSPDFASDQTLLVGGENGALALSTDAGESFSLLSVSAGAGRVTQIEFAADYATSGEVYIGTSNGLYVSTDYLNTLSSLPSFPVSWVSALALSPDYRTDGTLLFTTPTHGVFKSTDRGLNWVLNETGVELSDQTSYHFHDLKLSSNYSSDGTIFLATFEGMFRSTDFGNSWIELETRPPTLIMDVAMSPRFSQDSLMLVSTYGGGLYVSEDAGASWRVSSNGVSSPYLYDVAIRERTGSDPVLLTSHLNNLLISEDMGANWLEKKISNVLPGNCIASKMGASPDFANDNTVYLGCRKEGIVATQDGGDTWSLVLDSTQLGGGTITSIALSPDYSVDQTLMFSEHRGYFAKSSDEGLNWQLMQNGLPTPGRWYGGRGISFSPDYANDGVIFAATEKGIFGSPDEGLNWYPSSQTASPVAQGIISHISVSPDYANDGTILTSVRGRGLFRTDSTGSGWNQVGTDGLIHRYEIQDFVISPDFANDGLVIGWGQDHLYRSVDRGDSFQVFDIPFVRHEENRKQSVLYQGYWTKLENSLASGTSYRVSSTPGHEVSLLFVGTGVRWIGALADALGIANVYLDDVLVSTVDQYSAVPFLQQELYAVENLTLGTHEIRVVVTGERNPASLADWVLVDAFDVIR